MRTQFRAAYQGLIEDSQNLKVPRETPGVHYSVVSPTAVKSPKLLCWSEDVAERLGLKKQYSDELIRALAGNELLSGMKPVALRYGGHQFGHWAGQLGDGRAIVLGEINNFEVQLKGAGQTPYSRFADGRAVLRSSLREYLCSEAMHFLGVPTTRALALVTTGEDVVRDMFYDGHPEPEPGAIVTRVAESFLRFGNFEIHAAYREKEQLQQLLDYTLKRYYPGKTPAEFFGELVERTAHLMCEWYRVGFVHGVMNTDNMSILGVTIDYGPYGWLDVFDLNWTPNTTDLPGRRYAFGEQPNVAFWNLSCLAAALSTLDMDLSKELEAFPNLFLIKWQQMMAKKLGLAEFDQELVQELHEILQLQETDPTIFYRNLSEDVTALNEAFYQPLSAGNETRLRDWHKNWRTKASKNRDAVNPYFIPRNYIVQMAIDGLMKGDESLLRKIEVAMRTPYEKNAATEEFFKRRPDWARDKAGCSSLSCSS